MRRQQTNPRTCRLQTRPPMPPRPNLLKMPPTPRSIVPLGKRPKTPPSPCAQMVRRIKLRSRQGNPDPLGINDTLLLDVDQADMEEALRATCRLHGDGGESAQSADCGVEYPAAQDPVSRAAVSGRSGDTLLQPYATSNPEALVKELFCAPSMDCPQLMGAPFSKGVPVTSHAIIGVPKSHATRPPIALPDVDAYRNVDPLHAVFERSKDGEWMVTC